MLFRSKNVIKSKLKFEPNEVWDNVSDAAKNFVRRLLTKDPKKRPSAQEAQCDAWLLDPSEIKHVEDAYLGVHDGPILGMGAAGLVRKCMHKETRMEFAVKCLDIGSIEDNSTAETLRKEVAIMRQAHHPNIVGLKDVYEGTNKIYVIADLLKGGDMHYCLEEQPDYHYGEIPCLNIVKQMLSAVEFLHSKNVIHGDLKLGTAQISAE